MTKWRTHRAVGLPALFLSAALLVVSCSDGGGSSTTPGATSPTSAESSARAIHADETSAAKAMLLTVNDFPTGWAETPSDTSDSPLDKCTDHSHDDDRTGKAESGDFSRGSIGSISETVSIFHSADDVEALFAAIQPQADCFLKTVNDGKLDDDEAELSDASFSPLSFPTVGDHSAAFRIKAHVKAKNQTGFGSEGDFYVDVVYVRVGRVGLSVVAEDVFSPFDTTVFQEMVNMAVAKVTQP